MGWMNVICDAHKKKVGIKRLYNLGEDRKSSSLEIRRIGDKIRLRKPAPREAGPPGPWLSSRGEWERNADGHKSGGQYVAVLFGLQLPLTHNPFNKVRGIFF